MNSTLTEKEKEIKKIWIYNEQEPQFKRSDFDSDDLSAFPDSYSDFFDLKADECSDIEKEDSRRTTKSDTLRKLKKLSIVKLESISISSKAAQPQQIVNLNQSFQFAGCLKPSKQISTQTSQMEITQTCKITEDVTSIGIHHYFIRSLSVPPESAAFARQEKRPQADVQPKCALKGDGDKDTQKNEMKKNRVSIKPDLEIADFIPPMPVQCVMVRPKKSTPKFSCKKFNRPQTKYNKMRSHVLSTSNSETSTASCQKTEGKSYTKMGPKGKQQPKDDLLKKPENLLNYEMTSDLSTDCDLNIGGNQYAKLAGAVDKLQNLEWEVCMDGLRSLTLLIADVDWESEMGQKFIPVISRKLIDFFKSPRSNLCRTACQAAGAFFMSTKSTKRPEFDEMVDILLCKTSDPNRFIQKDASAALDKMAMSICVHHSVRAICSKGPDHKNCVIRSSTARILYQICKQAGNEQIIGSDANTRTRKRVLTTLGKFLIDKNLETRKHAEKLCKMLKSHKFFIDYFFKDVDSNHKIALRKILNSKEF